MSYETTFYNARWWVTYQGRLLGGYTANRLRPYVFPFYSPQGMLVLQESPPDHPHHQGICLGLEIDGHDLWNAGSFGKPPHPQKMEPALKALQPTITDDEVRFVHTVRWMTDSGEELLKETRGITFSAGNDLNLVTWQSIFTSPNKATDLGQTKEAGIGVRVPPQWETRFGGQIRNAGGDVGEAACFDKPSPWLNVQGPAVGESKAGLIIKPLPHSEACPWFVRDYGPQLYNPLRHHPITLSRGDSFTWSVQVIAYDGDRSILDLRQRFGADG